MMRPLLRLCLGLLLICMLLAAIASLGLPGRVIAHYVQQDTHYRIDLLDVDRRLSARFSTKNAANYCRPTWSPDGQHLVYASLIFDNQVNFYMGDADGRNQSLIIGMNVNGQADWSPDGQAIAFIGQHSPADYPEMYVISLEDGTLRRLTRNSMRERNPVWSPDGEYLVFVMDGDIYRIGRDGLNMQKLADGQLGMPLLSSDGTKIVYQSFIKGTYEIFVMDSDGANPHRLTNNDFDDMEPAWSPDGMQIAFQSYRGNTWDIYLINMDGSHERQLTGSPGQDSSPIWSPDGSEILFLSDRDGNPELYLIEANGDGLQRLTLNPGDDYCAAWQPSGNQ